jgi:drug/metabolite transporter (DMT)-like permease
MKPRLAWFVFLLVLVNLMWAGQGTAVKFLEGRLGPIATTFLPFYVATLLLIPLIWRARRGSRDAFPRRVNWGKFAIAGLAGQMVAQLGMTWGIRKSLASTGAILNLMIPMITAAFASVLLRERITALRLACLLTGLGGAFVLSLPDLRQSSFLHPGYLAGNLLILAGTCGSAFYNVYCKGLMFRFQEIEILGYSYVVASAASIPLLIWVEPFQWRMFGTFDVKAWAAFAFLAIFMYGVSMVLFFHVLQQLPVTVVSLSLYLIPVFGVLLASILVGERLTIVSIAGTALVLGSSVPLMKYDNLS